MHWELLARRWAIASILLCLAGGLVTWPFWRDTGGFIVRGTVLDQDGRPVADAVLTFDAYEQRMILPLPPYGLNYRSAKTVTRRTNDAGAFVVRSPRQKLELIAVDKPGYVFGPRHANKPGRHAPSRPLQWNAGYTSGTVHLDDVSRPEPSLISRDVVLRLERASMSPIYSMAPLYVNLSEGRTSRDANAAGGADLMISCEGDVVSIRAIGATSGVWVGNNSFRYAPSHGYAHGVAFQLLELDASGQATEMLFYAMTGHPARFSRIRVTVPKGSDEMRLSVKLNPTGSRDLRGGPEFAEPDIVGGRSTRVELGVRPWWLQCDRRTMALRSADQYPPASGIDRFGRNREDRYLAPPPPALPARDAVGRGHGWS
jgi:hypothetical protein